MIPGDIDLTENLDFRKTVRKNLPKIPKDWSGEKKGNFCLSGLTSVTSNMWSTRSVSGTSSYIWYSYGEDYPLSNHHGTHSSDNMYYIDLSYGGRVDSINDLNNNSSITLRYSREQVSTLSIKTTSYIEPKKDIFGNVIQNEKEIPKIPWRIDNNQYPVKTVPWGSMCRFRYTSSVVLDDIPWEIEEDPLPYFGTDNISKGKNLISWLMDKTSSFIRKYFEDSEDIDLSYLTNMSWIRVKNAIID